MRGIIGAGLAIALGAASGGVGAQEASQDQDIVVTGQKRIPAKEAHHYVRQISSTVGDQMARFRDPVCPAVIGLNAQYADTIARRIRQIAQRAGAPVDKEKCRPNLVVIVASDADRLVRDARKHIPWLFAGLETTELRRAMRDGPVHVWNTTQVRNEDGQGLKANNTGAGGDAPMLEVKTASFITLPTEQATVQSMVVLTADALLGKSLTQIADYVAMRALAGARPPVDPTPGDTILTLFDPGATPPPGASSLDVSYLDALYHSRPNQSAIKQKSEISRRLVRDFSPDGREK